MVLCWLAGEPEGSEGLATIPGQLKARILMAATCIYTSTHAHNCRLQCSGATLYFYELEFWVIEEKNVRVSLYPIMV
jgi:hypothetical protein